MILVAFYLVHFFANMLLGLLNDFIYLVVVHRVLLAVGGKYYSSEYGELLDRRHHDEGLLVEL